MTNKFFTQTGWLTRYAMACGYRHETAVRDYHVILSEYNRKLNTYQVQTFNRAAPEANTWEVYQGIKAARLAYLEYCYRQPATRYEAHWDIRRIVFA